MSGNGEEDRVRDRVGSRDGSQDGDPRLSSVRDGYDRWSKVYDHDANPLAALERPVVRRLCAGVGGQDALDLGCGTGRHTEWLVGDGARVVAVDFSPGMLEAARRKVGGADVRFITHDLHHPLPLDDAAFDLVVSGLVVEHLKDLDALFREVARVLRPGGRAVVSAMHPAMFLRGSQARFTDTTTGEIVAPGSLPHSVADLVMAAVRTGLTLETVEEHAPDAAFAARFPRAEKYVGYPMLLVVSVRRFSGE